MVTNDGFFHCPLCACSGSYRPCHKKRAKQYLLAKEPACAWVETELAFKKKTLIMDLVKYLTFSMILFLLGIWGIFLNRKNILIMLMSIELMLLAVDLNFLVFSVYLDDMMGQLFALFVLTVAAAESAIGLAILVITFRIRGTIAVEFRATVRIAYSHCLAICKLFAVCAISHIANHARPYSACQA
jgi:NADH:ubiquinone oxidoreductase subunit K